MIDLLNWMAIHVDIIDGYFFINCQLLTSEKVLERYEEYLNKKYDKETKK